MKAQRAALALLLPFAVGCWTDPIPAPTPPTDCVDYTMNSPVTVGLTYKDASAAACGDMALDLEPNDRLAQANYIGNPGKIEGNVGGDTDVFYVRGPITTSGGDSNQVSSTFAGENIRGCVFVACDEGHTAIPSCDSGELIHLPEGFTGCCTTSGGNSLTAHYQCDRTNISSAKLFFVVSRSDTGIDCAHYSIVYGF